MSSHNLNQDKNHILAPGASSICHFFLSTSPFLALFLYFLYLAKQRPSLPIYNLDDINDDAVRQQIVASASDESFISLTDMLYTFLIIFVLWSMLTVYLAFFVKKRRKLMERYIKGASTGSPPEDVITVLGDVSYEHPIGCCFKLLARCNNSDYAYVTYKYPHLDKDQNQNPDRNEATEKTKLMVEKRIRTYFPYHRERVSVLILPSLPLSGQPKADIERDIATYHTSYAMRNRDRIKYVLGICIFWMIFTLCGSIYILNQMGLLEEMDEDEDVTWGWTAFYVMVCGVAPLLSFGGNLLNWWRYRKWVTDNGIVTAHVTRLVPEVVGQDEFYEDPEEICECPSVCDDRTGLEGGGGGSYRAMH